MIDLTLSTIKVQDFRSIAGTIVVPVDASVVLIYGPNGSGKSSLMSAIGLALGGSEVSGLAEPRYLVHHNAKRASVELGTSDGPHAITIAPTEQHVPDGVLDPRNAAFFSERCYLEQTKLTRLLEIYQEKAAGEDSALTRFVKELLRIDELEALIDGLHAAGDVRRVRRDVPEFAQAETAIEESQKLAASLRGEAAAVQGQITERRRRIGPLLVALGWQTSNADVDPAGGELQSQLEDDREREELDRIQRQLRRVADLTERWERLTGEPESRTVDDAQIAEAAARDQLERWRQAHGNALDALLAELRADFPQLPSSDSASPSEAFTTATSSLVAEIERLDKVLAEDAATVERLEAAEVEAAHARARLETLDRQLVDDTAATEIERLASALADLAPHIVDDHCPVCGRDFSEVSERPLTAHLAEEISRLSGQATRLQSLAMARVETTTDLRRAEGVIALLVSQRLAPERKADAEARRRRHSEVRQRLRQHEQGALQGGTIMRKLVDAQSTLARAQSRNQANVNLRREVDELVAAVIPLEANAPGQLPGMALAALETSLSAAEKSSTERRERRETAARLGSELLRLTALEKELTAKRTRVTEELRSRRQALDVAQSRMMQARRLLHEVESSRRSIVRSVFNSALNKVWADLFVRLTPDEPYVPAFCDPDDAGTVTAELETRRRDGSRGGSPQTMLSAGNLNTAALTLFLALNLSVAPRVPWLLLDDPVQSMDEVHIAQFAALLRTLTQQHGRRLFVAVHERPLFDYLALELSPATMDGGLITIELRRRRDGGSEANHTWRKFNPEVSLGAA